jgi:hypothetical protein
VLLAVTLMLGALGLFSSRPWETTSLAPSVAVEPGLGAALGESVEVVPAGGPGIAAVHVAGGVAAGLAAEPVAVSKPEGDSSGPLLAVAAGRAVAQSRVAPAPSTPPEPPVAPAPEAQPVVAVPQPAAAAPPATTAPPVVASTGSGAPGTSGVVIPGGGAEYPPACEGDEYTFTVTPKAEDPLSEESALDILVQRSARDGSESELRLEGDLGDVRSLVSLLISEGNCVDVQFVPLVSEPPSEAPQPALEAVEPG